MEKERGDELVQLKCRCGALSRRFKRAASVGDKVKLSGFGFVWDIGNGLDTIFLCEACMRIIRDSWALIVKTVGTKNVNLACVKLDDVNDDAD